MQVPVRTCPAHALEGLDELGRGPEVGRAAAVPPFRVCLEVDVGRPGAGSQEEEPEQGQEGEEGHSGEEGVVVEEAGHGWWGEGRVVKNCFFFFFFMFSWSETRGTKNSSEKCKMRIRLPSVLYMGRLLLPLSPPKSNKSFKSC